jgi:hypothetical protein
MPELPSNIHTRHNQQRLIKEKCRATTLHTHSPIIFGDVGMLFTLLKGDVADIDLLAFLQHGEEQASPEPVRL